MHINNNKHTVHATIIPMITYTIYGNTLHGCDLCLGLWVVHCVVMHVLFLGGEYCSVCCCVVGLGLVHVTFTVMVPVYMYVGGVCMWEWWGHCVVGSDAMVTPWWFAEIWFRCIHARARGFKRSHVYSDKAYGRGLHQTRPMLHIH